MILTALFAVAAACQAPEFRQFDFWIGRWNVVAADGRPLGRNTITSVHGGCVLQEQWTGARGLTGSSVSTWDPRTKEWHQFWVDSSGKAWLSYDNDGNPSTIRGTFHDGVMEMTSVPGTKPMMRGTWKLLADGRVRQAFDEWDDVAKQWKTSFEGFYVRMPDDEAAVRETLDRYVAAWLAGDENGVMNLLTPDSILIPGEKPPYRGADAIRNYWFDPKAPKTILTRFENSVDAVEVSGDLAVARGTQIIEWTTSNERWRTHGNFTTMLRRTRDGWRIAQQMAGNTPAERLHD